VFFNKTQKDILWKEQFDNLATEESRYVVAKYSVAHLTHCKLI